MPIERKVSNSRFDVYLVGKKKNRVFVLDRNRCKGCSICIISCSYNSIIMGTTKSHNGFFYPIENTNSCVACKQCTYACPDFALSIHKLEDIKREI